MEAIAHFVMIPMTGVGIYDYKSDEWFAYRIKIFKEYTLKSLQNQSDKDFMLWLTFRPQELNHPLVKELEEHLRTIEMPTVMTFDGLMYWDDKFSAGIVEQVKNILRVLRQCWREKTWFGIGKIKNIWLNKKNRTLLQRLDKSIKELSTIGNPNEVKWVYLSRLDSDDMWHKDMAKRIHSEAPFEGALVCKKGHVHNSFTSEMAEWNPPTNPPFHTIIFPARYFFNPAYHKQYYRSFKSHEDIPKIFPVKQLPDYSYCVLIHGNHISTVWSHPFRGELVDNKLINDYV